MPDASVHGAREEHPLNARICGGWTKDQEIRTYVANATKFTQRNQTRFLVLDVTRTAWLIGMAALYFDCWAILPSESRFRETIEPLLIYRMAPNR